MAVPDYQTLMRPLLEHLKHGEVRVRDLIEPIAINLISQKLKEALKFQAVSKAFSTIEFIGLKRIWVKLV